MIIKYVSETTSKAYQIDLATATMKEIQVILSGNNRINVRDKKHMQNRLTYLKSQVEVRHG